MLFHDAFAFKRFTREWLEDLDFLNPKEDEVVDIFS